MAKDRTIGPRPVGRTSSWSCNGTQWIYPIFRLYIPYLNSFPCRLYDFHPDGQEDVLIDTMKMLKWQGDPWEQVFAEKVCTNLMHMYRVRRNLVSFYRTSLLVKSNILQTPSLYWPGTVSIWPRVWRPCHQHTALLTTSLVSFIIFMKEGIHSSRHRSWCC